MVIGGFPTGGGIPFSDTFYLDLMTMQYSPGPALLQKRGRMPCGILQTDTSKYVIVAGGQMESTFFSSTEYLNLDDPVEWKAG